MKRFIYFFLLAASIVATGCSDKSNTPSSKSAVAIKGHTYGLSADDGTYLKFYFATNFTCTQTSYLNGEYSNNSHFTYKIDGNNVDIYTDNSSIWKDSYRNTLMYHMVYYPYDDKLVWNNGIFTRMD